MPACTGTTVLLGGPQSANSPASAGGEVIWRASATWTSSGSAIAWPFWLNARPRAAETPGGLPSAPSARSPTSSPFAIPPPSASASCACCRRLASWSVCRSLAVRMRPLKKFVLRIPALMIGSFKWRLWLRSFMAGAPHRTFAWSDVASPHGAQVARHAHAGLPGEAIERQRDVAEACIGEQIGDRADNREFDAGVLRHIGGQQGNKRCGFPPRSLSGRDVDDTLAARARRIVQEKLLQQPCRHQQRTLLLVDPDRARQQLALWVERRSEERRGGK